jgi:2-phosphosulfolactate phosphatase
MSAAADPRSVIIDCFPHRVASYRDTHVIVAVDVLRATTTAVTATALGRRCFPVPALEAAVPLAARLENPLLVGELGGNAPYGFHLTNSPVQIAGRLDIERPMILLSTSGTPLLWESRDARAVYVACLRNVSAQVEELADCDLPVAVLGAGSRNEFREEDALCCARIAAGLLGRGFVAADEQTERVLARYADAPVDVCADGHSAEYLRQTGQMADLEFVLEHVDDLTETFRFDGREVVLAAACQPRRATV